MEYHIDDWIDEDQKAVEYLAKQGLVIVVYGPINLDMEDLTVVICETKEQAEAIIANSISDRDTYAVYS